jgi:hypothetical protein
MFSLGYRSSRISYTSIIENKQHNTSGDTFPRFFDVLRKNKRASYQQVMYISMFAVYYQHLNCWTHLKIQYTKLSLKFIGKFRFSATLIHNKACFTQQTSDAVVQAVRLSLSITEEKVQSSQRTAYT